MFGSSLVGEGLSSVELDMIINCNMCATVAEAGLCSQETTLASKQSRFEPAGLPASEFRDAIFTF
jgi:hypothetical protein